MLAALVLPYFTGMVGRADEKKTVVNVLSAIARLKQQAISYMKVGEMVVWGRDLVFYLDHREVGRLHFPKPCSLTRPVYFNRTGITAGGVLVLGLGRNYRITIAPVSGTLSVE